VTTGHNEAGRGGEFSELQIYNNRLLTFDDRTGDVFEILNKPSGKESFVVPRFVITEGDGDTDKGMKWEWATVKNGELYMGSMGKEYTNPDGSVANSNNLWVSVLNSHGEIRRLDWTQKYNFVREQLGATSPGYIINEAVNWSPLLKKWIFAPRRVSSVAYQDVLDEKRGSNKVVLVNEAFTQAQVVEVKMASKDGLHGFSSFAFIPNSNDRHVMALRSVEEDCAGDDLDVCKQRSYIVIFDVTTGEVLMDEVMIDEPMKFEGVEFVNLFTIPTK
jgi:soluble calcium-activated nucleotidase 1